MMLSKLHEAVSIPINHSVDLAKDFFKKAKETDKKGLVNDFLGIDTMRKVDTKFFQSKAYFALSANDKRE